MMVAGRSPGGPTVQLERASGGSNPTGSTGTQSPTTHPVHSWSLTSPPLRTPSSILLRCALPAYACLCVLLLAVGITLSIISFRDKNWDLLKVGCPALGLFTVLVMLYYLHTGNHDGHTRPRHHHSSGGEEIILCEVLTPARPLRP